MLKIPCRHAKSLSSFNCGGTEKKTAHVKTTILITHDPWPGSSGSD